MLIEVIDVDPASNRAYLPVDLNDAFLLAQDGLAPSESNPQFHQQMVYAVAMTTIRQFERALGRVAFWSDQRIRQPNGDYHEQFVRRLRIYPHALRERNAFYSPEHKALLFGYFPVTRRDADNTPGTHVFTALSHDIVAHESHPDVLAAVDLCLAKAEQQLRRYKEKIQDHRRRPSAGDVSGAPSLEESSEA